MTVQNISIDKIVIPDIRSNAVYSPEKWIDFVGSIKAGGIQFRPSCRQLPDGRIELVDGLHRIQAWKELGHADIEIDVEVMTDEQAATKHLVANHQRGESDPIGLSKVIKKLRDSGKTYDDIGKLIGYSASTVSKYEALQTLPDFVQDALTKQEIKIGHVQQFARLEDMSDVQAAMTYAIQQKWTVDMLKYWVDARIAERSQAYSSPSNAGGQALVPPPPTPDLAQHRQCLCCGAYGLASEMYYWQLGKECHDALEYLKTVNPNPWEAIGIIAQTQDELLKQVAEKDAKIKELSEKLIDVSLRLAPPPQPQHTQGQPAWWPKPAVPQQQNIPSGGGSQTP